MHVLIIGAGLGGLTLAQTLRKQGISYEIFEKDPDENGRFQGWAIAIHTITKQFLAALPDDMPDLKKATDHLAPLDLNHQFAYYYSGIDGCYGFEDSPEMSFIRAERSRLRKWLLTNLTVNWGKTLTDIKHDDNGVSVSFTDGTTSHGDIVVGADGAYSMTRQHLLQTPSTQLLHTVPLTAIVGELDLHDSDFTSQLSLGHSAYNLIYPDLGFIAFIGLHYVHPDARSGRFYWMFMQPSTSTPSSLHTSTPAEKLLHVQKTVSPLPPHLREIFDLTPASAVRPTPHIWRDLELDSVPSSRVILLGDAAHAMTPSQGQGAFHAFIDAMNLSTTLGALRADDKYKNIRAVEELVGGYNSEMLERGRAAVRASRDSYDEARKRIERKEQFAAGARKLTVEKVVLEGIVA